MSVEKFSNSFKKISVIVPAYNKENGLKTYLNLLIKELQRIPYDYELIIVNDGSQDKTPSQIKNFIKQNDQSQIKLISYPLNVGKGFALCYGFSQSEGDPVIFYDADLDIHPRQIRLLLEYLVLQNADIVIGSRRHPDSKTNYPLFRKIMSIVYQKLGQGLFRLNIKDTQLGLKIYRRKVLEKTLPLLTIKKWAFDLELLVAAQKNGFRNIIEAPIILTHQKMGSTIGITAIINVLKDTSAVFFRCYVKKHYNPNNVKNENPYLKLERYQEP